MNHSAKKIVTPLVDGVRVKTGNALLDAVPNNDSTGDNFYASGDVPIVKKKKNKKGEVVTPVSTNPLLSAIPNTKNTGDYFYAGGVKLNYADGGGNPLLNVKPSPLTGEFDDPSMGLTDMTEVPVEAMGDSKSITNDNTAATTTSTSTTSSSGGVKNFIIEHKTALISLIVVGGVLAFVFLGGDKK